MSLHGFLAFVHIGGDDEVIRIGGVGVGHGLWDDA